MPKEARMSHTVCTSGSRSPDPEYPPLLSSFRTWMLDQRGARPSTVTAYAPVLTRFLAALGGDPARYDAAQIRAFVLDQVKVYGRLFARRVTTALRGFLRHLVAGGFCSPALVGAVPTAVSPRDSLLPRHLPVDAVERMLASCDLTTVRGLRDRAVLLLLSVLGLRGGEVAGLTLAELDWAQATLQVAGKTRCAAILPLPQPVGDAILAYLRVRPASEDPHVFLRSDSVVRGFGSSSTVSSIVRSALHRAGVVSLCQGAHPLRHSFAVRLLHEGHSLQTIGAVLRHQSLDTTGHYARVDLISLRTVAQPWPGRQP